MAQFSQRTVKNLSDHMIEGVAPGGSVSGGFAGKKHLVVTLYRNRHPDGSAFHEMSAQLLAGANNMDSNGSVLNTMPNVGVARRGGRKPAGTVEVKSNEVMQTQVLDGTGVGIRWMNRIRISDTQYDAFRKEMAACGPAMWVHTFHRDGAEVDEENYLVQCELQWLHGDRIMEDGTRHRSVGAMPKKGTIGASPAVIPETSAKFRDVQREAFQKLKDEAAKGNLECVPNGPSQDAVRCDVLFRVYLDEDGNIPRSEPNRSGTMFVRGHLLRAMANGEYGRTVDGAMDDKTGRKRWDVFLDSEIVRRMIRNGLYRKIAVDRDDGTKHRIMLVAANVEMAAVYSKNWQTVAGDGEIRRPETIAELADDTWVNAVRSMSAKRRSHRMIRDDIAFAPAVPKNGPGAADGMGTVGAGSGTEREAEAEPAPDDRHQITADDIGVDET